MSGRTWFTAVLATTPLLLAACSGATTASPEDGASTDAAESAADLTATSKLDPKWVAAVQKEVVKPTKKTITVDPDSLTGKVLKRRQRIDRLNAGNLTVQEAVLPQAPNKTAFIFSFLHESSEDHDVAVYDEAGTFVAWGIGTELDPDLTWSAGPVR